MKLFDRAARDPVPAPTKEADTDGWHNWTLVRWTRQLGPYSLQVFNEWSEDQEGVREGWRWLIEVPEIRRFKNRDDMYRRGGDEGELLPGAVRVRDGQRGPHPCESLEDGKAKAVAAVRGLVAEAMAVLTEAGLPLPVQDGAP